MRICVVGAGGVGGYFGARLAADGNDVIFVARGAHRAAMAARGLRVISANGDVHVEKPQLYDDPVQAGLCDIVLFCVKLWDSEPAAALVRPLLTHDTALVSFQNGVVAADLLSGWLGPQYVLGGVAEIPAAIAEPGVIRHTGKLARLSFGERDGSTSWRAEALHAACQGAGIEARLSTDIERDIWKKFVFLAPLAGAAAFHRVSLGVLRAAPDKRRLLEGLVAETLAVARAKGQDLDADVATKVMAGYDALPPETKPSMLHDLEAGRRLELDWLNGEVVRIGRAHGIDTPDNAAVVAALEPFALGRTR